MQILRFYLFQSHDVTFISIKLGIFKFLSQIM